MQSTLRRRQAAILIGGLNGIPRAMEALKNTLTESDVICEVIDLLAGSTVGSILEAVNKLNRTHNIGRRHVIVGYSAGAMIPFLANQRFQRSISIAVFWDPSMSLASLFPKSPAFREYGADWIRCSIETFPILCFQSQHWAQHAAEECRLFERVSSECFLNTAHDFTRAGVEEDLLAKTLLALGYRGRMGFVRDLPGSNDSRL